MVALNRNSTSQIASRYAAFGAQFPESHWPLSFSAPKPQRFKSQRLQDANATKSQMLALHKSQRFSATKDVENFKISEILRELFQSSRWWLQDSLVFSAPCTPLAIRL